MSHPNHLLYLHGFRSSPQSKKAQLFTQAIAQLQAQGEPMVWQCPQLPPSPAQAIAELKALTANWPTERMAIIGSSLGGFYATVLAEAIGCQAVLLNPAVAPARDLARYIGEQRQFHNEAESFYFQPIYVDELTAMAPYPITRPERYHVMMSQGDEVLDWREMQAAYAGAHHDVLPANDHAISDFECHLPKVWQWLGLPARQG